MKMIKRGLAAVLVLSLLLLAAACSGGSKSVTITDDELNREVEKTISQYEAQGQPVSDEQRAELRQAVLTQLVERKLLLAAARAEGIALEEGVMDAELEKIKSQFPTEEAFAEALSQRGYDQDSFTAEMSEIMLIQKFLEEEVASSVELSDEELMAFYEENPSYFETPESVSAAHILIQLGEGASDADRAEALRKIEAVAARVEAGEDFAELAKEYSEGPSGPNGGDLGSFQRGRMVPAFEEVAFSLSPGEVSGVVETQFGYHLIKVSEKSEAGTMGFEEAKEAIRGFLQQQKEQEAVTAYIEELKEEYTVEQPEV